MLEFSYPNRLKLEMKYHIYESITIIKIVTYVWVYTVQNIL